MQNHYTWKGDNFVQNRVIYLDFSAHLFFTLFATLLIVNIFRHNPQNLFRFPRTYLLPGKVLPGTNDQGP